MTLIGSGPSAEPRRSCDIALSFSHAEDARIGDMMKPIMQRDSDPWSAPRGSSHA